MCLLRRYSFVGPLYSGGFRRWTRRRRPCHKQLAASQMDALTSCCRRFADADAQYLLSPPSVPQQWICGSLDWNSRHAMEVVNSLHGS